MPSNGNRGLFSRGTGTLTVIEEPVMRSYKRKARIVFWVGWAITGLLAATIAASQYPPVLALIFGGAIGILIAGTAAVVTACWPVLRAIWWWAPETIITGSILYGWIELAVHTNLITRLFSVAIIGLTVGFKPIRVRIHSLTWCLVTRHRLRTCFSEFIITNRTGSLPFILAAIPTPVGERVWIWLRPGLSMDDIQERLDQIAVACWAREVYAERASESNSAFIRFDIKRRDALTGTITSPLLHLIRRDTTSSAPAALIRTDTLAGPSPAADTPATGLDLPQVSATDIDIPKAARIPRPVRTATPAPVPDDGHDDTVEDLSDWF